MLSRFALVLLILLVVSGCGASFQPNVTPIHSPEEYSSSFENDGLKIGFEFLNPGKQIENFGVDLTKANIQPVRIVVLNDSIYEFHIQDDQIFGRTKEMDLYPVYRIDQTTEQVLKSEIGAATSRGAITGLAGLIVGAAAGAVIGEAVWGDASEGAVVGGTIGALSGAASATDAMDTTSLAIKEELRKINWGNRVIHPGQIEYGFLFFKTGPVYEALRFLIFNVNQTDSKQVIIPVR